MKNENCRDCLSKNTLRAYLRDEQALLIRVLEEIDSTNNEAKRIAIDSVPTGGRWLIAAERQSAGRGRMGRSFYSPDGSGVYFSLLIPVCGPLPNAVSITCAASVAVLRAIRTLTGKQVAIKWVNDLLLDGKKVCGILCEAVSVGDRHALVIGIGINLKSAEFPPELCNIAGTLGADEVLRAQMIATVYRELKPFLEDPNDRSFLQEYRAYSAVLGKRVVWMQNGERFEGLAEEIGEDGALAVRADDGSLAQLRTGEISLRLT